MLTTISIGLGYNNGVKEWIIQRISAVFIAIYSFLIFGFIVYNNDMTYEIWCSFFSNIFIKIITSFVIMFLIMHIGIGIWIIITDYIKSSYLKLIFCIAVDTILIIYIFFSIFIIWSI